MPAGLFITEWTAANFLRITRYETRAIWLVWTKQIFKNELCSMHRECYNRKKQLSKGILMRYFTKEWFLKCQIYPQTKALKDELNDAAAAFHAAQSKDDLPSLLRRELMLHDGEVSNIETAADCVVEVNNSPYAVHQKIRFTNALVKQALPPIGAIWLYEELYRHKRGVGYEVHILFHKPMPPKHKAILASDLFETKIICDDIVFE